jgi:hypothetical protein
MPARAVLSLFYALSIVSVSFGGMQEATRRRFQEVRRLFIFGILSAAQDGHSQSSRFRRLCERVGDCNCYRFVYPGWQFF